MLLVLTIFLLSNVGTVLSVDVIISSCSTVGITLATANSIVNVSCTSVVLSNVVVQGSMILNVSISGMMAANPDSPKIALTISKMTVQAGATLAIDSRDHSAPFGSGPTVSIMIESLVGNDGCLVFLGSLEQIFLSAVPK